MLLRSTETYNLFLYVQHPFSLECIKILQLILLVVPHEDLLCFGAIFPLTASQYNMLESFLFTFFRKTSLLSILQAPR